MAIYSTENLPCSWPVPGPESNTKIFYPWEKDFSTRWRNGKGGFSVFMERIKPVSIWSTFTNPPLTLILIIPRNKIWNLDSPKIRLCLIPRNSKREDPLGQLAGLENPYHQISRHLPSGPMQESLPIFSKEANSWLGNDPLVRLILQWISVKKGSTVSRNPSV